MDPAFGLAEKLPLPLIDRLLEELSQSDTSPFSYFPILTPSNCSEIHTWMNKHCFVMWISPKFPAHAWPWLHQLHTCLLPWQHNKRTSPILITRHRPSPTESALAITTIVSRTWVTWQKNMSLRTEQTPRARVGDILNSWWAKDDSPLDLMG